MKFFAFLVILPSFLCISLASANRSPALDAVVQTRMLDSALRQAETMTGDFEPSQRDCAGFVRYIFRKGLRARSSMWRDRHGKWVDYLPANELVAFNFRAAMPEPRNESELRTGDVLVFYSPEKPPLDAWHLMVVLRPPHQATRKTLVVYHNGERGLGGQVRKIWLEDLFTTSFSEWRPTRGNAHFLGVFRWKGFISAKEHG